MRPPKCKIGRSKHQPIGENTEIQRNTHSRIIQPAEMNCIINFRRVNVSKDYDLESTQQRHIPIWFRAHVPPGPPLNRHGTCNKGTTQLSRGGGHVPSRPLPGSAYGTDWHLIRCTSVDSSGNGHSPTIPHGGIGGGV